MSENEAEEDIDIDIPFAPGVDDESASEDPTIAGNDEEDDVPLGVVEDEEEDVNVDIPFASPTVTADKTGGKISLWATVSAAAAALTGKMVKDSKKNKSATEDDLK
ncbi:MAG: hypothetical protein IJF37_02805 [Lachnospiraceae bacterium]|nr:hypothetical protein [Lachnospiraceae bacterium]